MRVTTSEIDGVTVVTLSGDVDAGAADSELLAMVAPMARVLVDLGEVAHVTSAGVRTLLLVYRQAQCLDTTVALVGLSAQLREVLRAVGFLGFFVVVDSVAEGVALLSGAGAAGRGSPREPVDA